MNEIERGPTLQSNTSTGKVKYWYGSVVENDNGVFITKTWWQEGSKVQTSTPKQIFGKNVGKSNETTALEQATFDLGSLYRKQRDKGYSEDGSLDHIPTLPMLAHKYADRSHNITFPCFVQPKLDGNRMLLCGDKATTRGAKDYIPEVVSHLIFDTYGVTIDGELMLPDNMPLQQSSQAIKKYRPGLSDELIYWVYDIVDENLPFRDRAAYVHSMFSRNDIPENVRWVPTHIVHNEEEIYEKHYEFCLAGFEGTMVRNFEGGYTPGKRSANLQKVKDFQDAEFKIVDIEEGTGSFEGKAILVCDVGDGRTFKAVPRGTMEYRAELYENRISHIGRWYTIKYQSLSDEGIPVGNTVGIDFRDEGEF